MSTPDPKYRADQIGASYPLIARIGITYAGNNNGRAEFEEQRVAVIDGMTRFLGIDRQIPALEITPERMSESAPWVDPATGALIPGQSTTMLQLYMGLLAWSRVQQKVADAAAAPAPQPEQP